MKIKPFLIILLSFLLAIELIAQGCSDAGVCSLGSMKPEEIQSIYGLSIGQTAEIGEKGTFISSTMVEAKAKLSELMFIQARLPYSFTSGKLGNNLGLGDLLTSINIQFWNKNDVNLILTLGAKLALGDANDKNNLGQAFPMPYQISSGTNDFMIGMALKKRSWHYALGYQHVLNRNKNSFTHELWLDNIDAQAYFESNKLKRGDDLMFRISKTYFKKKRSITLSLLPIWRLQKDELIDENEIIKPLNHSNQLTINVNMAYNYELNEILSLKMNLGSPILWRKTRADGLTRFFVFYFGINYQPS